eukprot:14568.XXX_830990_830691_1 [CDS] Oithona nana genome sequencing.
MIQVKVAKDGFVTKTSNQHVVKDNGNIQVVINLNKPEELRKVMIMVQDDKQAGLADATIKVDSVEEATKTGADGKLTLAKEY